MLPTIQWARRVRRGLQAALVVAAGALSVQAQAYTVSLLPAVQTVNMGATVAVQLTVSDLGSLGVGAYDFSLSFNASVLDYVGFTDGLSLGADAFGLDVTEGVGSLVASDVSFVEPLLLAGQQSGRGSLTLFTLFFNAIGAGTSSFGMLSGNLSDVAGTSVEFNFNSASVTVQANTPNPMPVPGTLPLALAGLFAAAVARRRHLLT